MESIHNLYVENKGEFVMGCVTDAKDNVEWDFWSEASLGDGELPMGTKVEPALKRHRVDYWRTF